MSHGPCYDLGLSSVSRPIHLKFLADKLAPCLGFSPHTLVVPC